MWIDSVASATVSPCQQPSKWRTQHTPIEWWLWAAMQTKWSTTEQYWCAIRACIQRQHWNLPNEILLTNKIDIYGISMWWCDGNNTFLLPTNCAHNARPMCGVGSITEHTRALAQPASQPFDYIYMRRWDANVHIRACLSTGDRIMFSILITTHALTWHVH